MQTVLKSEFSIFRLPGIRPYKNSKNKTVEAHFFVHRCFLINKCKHLFTHNVDTLVYSLDDASFSLLLFY